MSAINPPLATDAFGNPVTPGKNYWNASTGIMSWLFTLDHKRIGIMYLILILGAFFLGGIFAIALRIELMFPGPTLTFLGEIDPETGKVIATQVWAAYNQMFTLHGAIMVFMFIIPAIPAILGNFILPLMLGAKDVAFPRLNLLSWYCYVVGAVFFVWTLGGGLLMRMIGKLMGLAPGYFGRLENVGLDTGWTFYTPYSTWTSTAVISATLGAFVLGFSSILTGLNFIATVHMLRRPGQGWLKLPLFIWGIYATAVIQILATPVLAITLLLLAAERFLGIGIFDPAKGGNPVLFQHFFWFYSHPAVYIMILPGMAIVSEVIATFSRKHIFGYGFIAASSMAIAILGFLVWGHHLFTSGQSPMLSAIFSFITFFIAVPSGIKIFNWLATMYRGSISLDTPMLYALSFIWLFTIGGLTGIFCATLSVDLHIHDTYFIVAHFHYVMVGSTLTAFLAGMHYWWPKMFGKMYNEAWGRVGAILVFIGFNLTFFVQFIAGSQGMPRRYADYIDQFQTHHFISTIGSFVLALGLFVVLFVWIASLIWGRKAPVNPWGGNSLEWQTANPPVHLNFDEEPVVGDPYDYDDLHWDEKIGGYIKDRPSSASNA